MTLEESINKKFGSVKIPLNHEVTFEVIEKIYKQIIPLLRARRKKGLVEGVEDKF